MKYILRCHAIKLKQRNMINTDTIGTHEKYPPTNVMLKFIKFMNNF